MKKPRISKKVLETYLQCSRLGPNNCNDIYFAFEDMEQEIARLNHIFDELKEDIQNLIYDIQPKGCLILFNCEYDSEEDYIKGMKKEERLRTLEEVLDKLKELKEEGKE